MKKNYFFRTMSIAVLATTFAFGAVACSDSNENEGLVVCPPGGTEQNDPDPQAEIRTTGSYRDNLPQETLLLTKMTYDLSIKNNTIGSDNLRDEVHEYTFAYRDDSLISQIVVDFSYKMNNVYFGTTKTVYDLTYNDDNVLISAIETIESFPMPSMNATHTYAYSYKDGVIKVVKDEGKVNMLFSLNEKGQIIGIKDSPVSEIIINYSEDGNICPPNVTKTLDSYHKPMANKGFTPILVFSLFGEKRDWLNANNDLKVLDTSKGPFPLVTSYDAEYDYNASKYPILEKSQGDIKLDPSQPTSKSVGTRTYEYR